MSAFYVHAIAFEARDVHTFELRPDGGAIGDVEPGAHIDVGLPNGLTRQYSLLNPPGVRDRYVIGVKRDAKSRGGSRFMHDELRVGMPVDVAGLRNNFTLANDDAPTVLVAGGIGVTPIVTMAEHLAASGRPARVMYAVRSRDDLAFSERLSQAASLTTHVDDERGAFFDVHAALADVDPAAHVYCCGPAPMLDAFIAATSERRPELVHFERFGADVAPSLAGDAFTVELARTGVSVAVAEGQSILHALRLAGISALSSCEEGYCGTCEVGVLGGSPDHRDGILSAADRAAGTSMMICCSRSKSERLVLDL